MRTKYHQHVTKRTPKGYQKDTKTSEVFLEWSLRANKWISKLLFNRFGELLRFHVRPQIQYERVAVTLKVKFKNIGLNLVVLKVEARLGTHIM